MGSDETGAADEGSLDSASDSFGFSLETEGREEGAGREDSAGEEDTAGAEDASGLEVVTGAEEVGAGVLSTDGVSVGG